MTYAHIIDVPVPIEVCTDCRDTPDLRATSAPNAVLAVARHEPSCLRGQRRN